jgi:hypothetical protein
MLGIISLNDTDQLICVMKNCYISFEIQLIFKCYLDKLQFQRVDGCW